MNQDEVEKNNLLKVAGLLFIIFSPTTPSIT
jgi:hypothetical protein